MISGWMATIFALLVGARIDGIVGIYLAIPFLASLRVNCFANSETAGGLQESGQP
jgi:predicted PurR-regulated permease PerM